MIPVIKSLRLCDAVNFFEGLEPSNVIIHVGEKTTAKVEVNFNRNPNKVSIARIIDPLNSGREKSEILNLSFYQQVFLPFEKLLSKNQTYAEGRYTLTHSSNEEGEGFNVGLSEDEEYSFIYSSRESVPINGKNYFINEEDNFHKKVLEPIYYTNGEIPFACKFRLLEKDKWVFTFLI